MTLTEWTATWLEAFEAERGRQWMWDGTAREVAEAKGWRIIDADLSRDMVLVEAGPGRLLAIGAIPKAYGFWSVEIPAA